MRLRNRDLFEEQKMPFGDHIEELRGVLLRSLLGIAIGFLIGLAIAKPVIRFVEQPLRRNLQRYLSAQSLSLVEDQIGAVDASFRETITNKQLVLRQFYVEQTVCQFLQRTTGDEQTTTIPTSDKFVPIRFWESARSRLVVLSATEPFLTWLKAAFLCGLLVASPYVLWQIWSFVGAGLFRNERRVVYAFMPMSLVLFGTGAAIAFLLVFDPVLEFLFSYAAEMHIELTPRLTDWMGFVLFLPIGFGVAFQLPLVMLALNRLGIVSIKAYLQHWRLAILAIFVASMVLTPQEPVSMMAMALPLLLLYFLGVVLCRIIERRNRPMAA